MPGRPKRGAKVKEVEVKAASGKEVKEKEVIKKTVKQAAKEEVVTDKLVKDKKVKNKKEVIEREKKKEGEDVSEGEEVTEGVEEEEEVATSSRGRRKVGGTKAWAALIPRSRSASQAREEVSAPSSPTPGKVKGRSGGRRPPSTSSLTTPSLAHLLTPTSTTPLSSTTTKPKDAKETPKSGKDGKKGATKKDKGNKNADDKEEPEKEMSAPKRPKAFKVKEARKTAGQVAIAKEKAQKQQEAEKEDKSGNKDDKEAPVAVARASRRKAKGGGSEEAKASEEKSGNKSKAKNVSKVTNNVEDKTPVESKKVATKTKPSAVEMTKKIDSYFKKSADGKSERSSPRKRKSEDDGGATPAKKSAHTKVLPKKSLAHRDILNLLDDYDDEKEEEKEEEEGEKEVEETEVSFKSSGPKEGKVVSKAPVWRRSLLQASNTSRLETKAWLGLATKEDVFNPDNYGEEEFGKEDPNAKVKKARRRKKNAKAIFVFGEKQENAAEVKASVKASHHLRTPGQARKPSRKRIQAALPAPVVADRLTSLTASSAAMATSDFTSQPEEQEGEQGDMDHQGDQDTDYSHGAQNFFDSQNQQGSTVGSRAEQSGVFGTTLPLPPPAKSYHTPNVPRTHARLQTQSVSTPNPKDGPPVSTKELIQNNFGFEDSEDEELDRSQDNSLAISPVKPVAGNPRNPVLNMFQDCSVLAGPSASRLSVLPSRALPSQARGLPSTQARVPILQAVGPSRFHVSPSKHPVVSARARLLQQVEESRRQRSNATQGSRHKKLSKKRPPPAALEQSSLYEEVGEQELPRIDQALARLAERGRSAPPTLIAIFTSSFLPTSFISPFFFPLS